MPKRFDPAAFAHFLCRNLALILVLFTASRPFSSDLSMAFLAAAFLLAVFLALGLHAFRLRFLPALAAAALLPFLLRGLLFLAFGGIRAAFPGLDADLSYFFFDKDFFPALIPFFTVVLFNLAALRRPGFCRFEPALTTLLLIALCWSQGGYHVTLFPHPFHLAAVAVLFTLLQGASLLLARLRFPFAAPERGRERRGLTAFAIVFLPLLLVLLALLWLRISAGAVRQGGGLVKPTLLRFDFSPYVRLENEISLSDELVLLLRKEGPAERILLRRYILSGFKRDQGFFRVDSPGVEEFPTTVEEALGGLPEPRDRARLEVRQDYFLVNFDPSSLIALNVPVRVASLANWDSSSFLRITRVTSRVSAAGPAELLRARPQGLSPAQMRLYTDFGGDERIRALAEEITAGAKGPYEQAEWISDYLKDNYLYSLKPGIAVDGDPLAHFLFSSKKGYCSYFAFAMALLCRSLGIPARVAVGFLVDPRSELLNFYEVRAHQAHAWVEVHLGEYGWVEFDPSSERLAPGEELAYRFVFDAEKLARLIEEILANQDRLHEEGGPEAASSGRPWVRSFRPLLRFWALGLPLLYLLVMAAIKLRFLPKTFRGGARDRVRAAYRHSLGGPYGLGWVQEGDESLLEYGRRLDREHGLALEAWTSSYLEAVYAKRFGAKEVRGAGSALREYKRSWRRSRGLLLRILAFLNPCHSLRRRG